jgi:hypothetical protein
MMLRQFSFAVILGAALLSSASTALADGPYEPNESVTQAWGPMAGGAAHDAAIETSNDEDWFYFYTAGQRQFEVVLTYRSKAGPNSYSSARVILRERDGDEIESAYVDEDEDDRIGRITFTSSGSAKYNLSVTGEEGVRYSVQVNPADALTPEPPVECFNHVHSFGHVHVRRHIHRRRHRHRSGRVHIHRRVHRHRRVHTHYEDHLHCEPAPRQVFGGAPSSNGARLTRSLGLR